MDAAFRRHSASQGGGVRAPASRSSPADGMMSRTLWVGHYEFPHLIPFKQNGVPKLAKLLASCHKFPLCAPRTEAAELPLVLLLVFYFEQSAKRWMPEEGKAYNNLPANQLKLSPFTCCSLLIQALLILFQLQKSAWKHMQLDFPPGVLASMSMWMCVLHECVCACACVSVSGCDWEGDEVWNEVSGAELNLST